MDNTNKALNLLKNRSVQVILTIVIYLCVASLLPLNAHRAFYSLSLLIKDLLLWILPFSVGFFIAHALCSFEKKAPLFIFVLFIFEALSNFSSVWYAYFCGHVAISHQPVIEINNLSDSFSPLFSISKLKPALWSADKGTFAGIILGLIASFKFPLLRNFIAKGKQKAEWILTKIFSRLIPLFILGFVARMYKTRLLTQMLDRYSELILWLLVVLVLYISMLFLLGSGLSFKKYLNSIKNLLPAGGIAFSSGCSLSTMPWTIQGTAKNLISPDLAKTVIPATTNIQQIGDCISNTFLCFLIYFHYFGHAPSIAVWVPFSLVFILARFATAAVLGGSVFIMLPIYESYLHFNAEMIAMILALNVILDPIITCTNVVANGALCRVFEKVWMALQRKPATEA